MMLRFINTAQTLCVPNSITSHIHTCKVASVRAVMYREVQQDFSPEIEEFGILSKGLTNKPGRGLSNSIQNNDSISEEKSSGTILGLSSRIHPNLHQTPPVSITCTFK